MIKSTAYKVYWAGRYLERIENIARFGVYFAEKGIPIEDMNKILGIDDVFSYLFNEFKILREDIRAFGDEASINALSALEASIYAKNNDLKSYFMNVLNSALYVLNVIEENLKPKSISIMPKKQEEIRSQ
ncbi:hypothetical protein BFU36_07905 [Sulfolobus sp. A20]|uniref:alpha-E domain-containing protein n=1 Tax=Sulfolobaceae TaxID=118883 RepID=UPI0008461389|nr:MULTISPECIES: alpha-E domain-containing protein [unclassified Sulfolobus]TRM75801.1 hypothetical protein DJ532_09230 [Sulfolobus sp. A20-N-F8]TRM75910.1 hypothetical protein DJ523_02055 [Sulfolobus sp. E5]TRM78611.1 hypothetical protein DJ528_04520 [Sulfolobus sp. B5]TRM79987.1 hypothetical protein DJ524_08970 [Sulfolobus sp. D5]TRM82727.1 hypothetical protein DJ522_07110 [Sulfolobus sp. F3]TRM83798.1 hypothetical protein DJ531_03760 [Sulfolobus sp. A20-N-F6]TRM88187.1 hypothetical protei